MDRLRAFLFRSNIFFNHGILCALFVLGTVTAQQVHSSQKTAQDMSATIRFPVEKFTLSNGLTVLLYEDHSSPIVTYHQWFRVGSKDEKVGRTGLAHFFEHLMFKGTDKFPGKEFDRIIQSNGGDNNAFTSEDYTGYYMNLPSDKVELAVQIESDRMRNLLFDSKEIQSEREVVKEERRYRVENDISGMISEKMNSLIYTKHNYRWPVIGYMKDLNAASMDDLKEFYRVFYAPNNAVVVVAGDIHPSKIRAMIEKYYSPLQAQPLPKMEYPSEPEQKQARQVVVSKEVQSVTAALGYRIAHAGEDHAYALDLLANIIGKGPSSRLYRKFVYQDQIANAVAVWSYTQQLSGIFQINISLKPGQDGAQAITKIERELVRLRQDISDQEIEKAKNQIMKDYVDGIRTLAGKAQALALNEIYYRNYAEMFRDLQRYQQVTREQVLEVLKLYLTPQRKNVVLVVPKGGA